MKRLKDSIIVDIALVLLIVGLIISGVVGLVFAFVFTHKSYVPAHYDTVANGWVSWLFAPTLLLLLAGLIAAFLDSQFWIGHKNKKYRKAERARRESINS